MCGERFFRFRMPFFEFAGLGLGGVFPSRRFASRRAYLRWLETYKEELEAELQMVKEEIETLRRETVRA